MLELVYRNFLNFYMEPWYQVLNLELDKVGPSFAMQVLARI